MAEHWIDADTAYCLIAGVVHPASFAHEVLCQRAHAGLIKARARLLILGPRKLESADVPSGFWWAKGQAALHQNWVSGDFSTWIDLNEHWQAFGVTFALEGVLEILPLEQRATTAHRLSVAGNSAWVPARDARKLAYEKAGVSITRAGTAILDQAQLGFLSARAVLARRADTPKADGSYWEQREWNIPAWFWQNLAADKTGSKDWERGLFTAKGSTPNGTYAIALTGVHFLAEALQALLPADESGPQGENAPAEAPPKGKGGGRPPQPWWDDMWCAVWGLIHQGDFKPKTKADVERAMLTWATLNGHEVTEAAVRPKARKLFEAMNSEARNFLDA